MRWLRRAVFRLWLHTADALVMRLDQLFAPPPPDLIWVPEARPDEGERWEA